MELTTVQQKNLAQFVHDATEMEEAIYTLDKMEVEAKRQKDQLLYNAQEKYNNAEEAVQKCSSEYNHRCSWENNELRSKPPKLNIGKIIGLTFKYFFVHFIPCVLGFGIICGIILGIMASTNGYRDEDNFFAIAAWGGGAILSLLTAIIRANYEVKQEYLNEKEKCENSLKWAKESKRDAEKSLQSAQSQFSLQTQNLGQAQATAAVMDEQIGMIRSKRNEIAAKLTELYGFGLIPPDYRQMDCVIMLDQIFRNGLADDMRSAILLYEERVRHGEIIRGLDKIASMLGRLSQGMSAITYRLESINGNVTRMSRDLENYNELLLSSNNQLLKEMKNNRQATQELIEKTEIGNYTSEQLLESQKKILYYHRLRNSGGLPDMY